METRSVLSPSLGPVPHVRDIVFSEEVSSSSDKWVVQPFNLSGLSRGESFENMTEEKVLLVAVEGCMLTAFILGIFDVCFMELQKYWFLTSFS